MLLAWQLAAVASIVVTIVVSGSFFRLRGLVDEDEDEDVDDDDEEEAEKAEEADKVEPLKRWW